LVNLSGIFIYYFYKNELLEAMDDNNNSIKKEDKEETNYKYKCEECGIDFGNSLGDMEVHKLTVHLQKGDTEIE